MLRAGTKVRVKRRVTFYLTLLGGARRGDPPKSCKDQAQLARPLLICGTSPKKTAGVSGVGAGLTTPSSRLEPRATTDTQLLTLLPGETGSYPD